MATWQARTDVVERGYSPQTIRLWEGVEPTAAEAQIIAHRCRHHQADMLIFARAGDVIIEQRELTLADLINKYQTDPASRHRKKRYHTRTNHDLSLRRMSEKWGQTKLAEIRAKHLIVWYDEWSDNGKKVATGHQMMGHLRTMFGFGAVVLEDPECERLRVLMGDRHLSVPLSGSRDQVITADQAIAVRRKAREAGLYSIALAQALQFDLILRQKDVIGEWVPMSEPELSDVTWRRLGKWIRGLRWEEVDEAMILTHTTSKKQKPLVVDLSLAPMVREELEHLKAIRGSLPAKGPIVVCELTGRPWEASNFRRNWRKCADRCNIPRNVYNMDSRAGAITEARESGADMEKVRDAATHSNIATTERYSRMRAKKATAIEVQKIRLGARNGSGTGND